MKTTLTAVLLAVVLIGAVIGYNRLKDQAPAADFSSTAARTDTGQAARDSEPPSGQPEDNVKAPDFTVTDAEGNEKKLSDLAGKPVVLNFWASWCPPCKSEMPEFDNMYEELGSQVHFMMVDATDGSRETVETGEAYITEAGYSFPVYYDACQEASAAYGIRALPTSLFIDAEGYVAAAVEGAIDKSTLQKGIDLIYTAE